MALNGLDDRLEAFIPRGVGYYVELGANDGIAQSNSYWPEGRTRVVGSAHRASAQPVPGTQGQPFDEELVRVYGIRSVRLSG
jgi:hypothetical protein